VNVAGNATGMMARTEVSKQRNHLARWHCMVIGVGSIATMMRQLKSARLRMILRTAFAVYFTTCAGPNQFRRAAEFGARPGRRYDGGASPRRTRAPAKRVCAGACRPSGEGLAGKQSTGRAQPNPPVRCEHRRRTTPPKREFNEVAGIPVPPRVDGLPFAVSLNRGVECQTGFEGGKSCLRAAFLEVRREPR